MQKRMRARAAWVAPALLLLVTGCGQDDNRVAVQFVDAVPIASTPESRDVTITVGVGACDDDPRSDVEETATTVAVTITMRRSQNECTDQLEFLPVDVHLDRPLGTRRVVDGSGPG